MPSTITEFNGKGSLEKAINFSESVGSTVYALDHKSNSGSKKYIVTDTSYTEIISQDRHLYEVTVNDKKFHEVFDIDQKDIPENIKTSQEAFLHFTTEYEKIRDTFGLPAPDWRVMDASNKSKLSLRLINRNLAFESISQFKQWYKTIRPYLGFDISIARQNGVIRTYNQSKIGQGRQLIPPAWHPASASADISEFSIHNINPSALVFNVPYVNTSKTFTRVCHSMDSTSHASLAEYVIDHLPNDFGDTDMSRWINGVIMCRQYGSRSLAHKLASKSIHYSKKHTDRLYDQNLKYYAKNYLYSLLRFLKEYMDEDSYNEFKRHMPYKYETLKQTDIKADEIINEPKVDMLKYVNQDYEVIYIKSGVMTYKSQSIKDVIGLYDTIMAVCSRVASVKDNVIEKYNGILNSYQEAGVNEPKICTTVDSLLRWRGQKDLLVLDEIESIFQHLVTFPKNRRDIWEQLCEYIRTARLVIVCDATLRQSTIDAIQKIRKWQNEASPISIVIDNQYQSMKGRTCDIEVVGNRAYPLKETVAKVKSGKKLVVPTNSKKFAEMVYSELAEKYKCLLMCDGMPIVDCSQWKDFDVVIYSPTITAGISQNEIHFDEVVAFFTNRSTNTEIAFQMLNRCRNPTTKHITIYYEHTDFDIQDESAEAVKEKIKHLEDLHSTGLAFSMVKEEVIEDTFFDVYCSTMVNVSKCKNNFIGRLRGILDSHGYSTNMKILDSNFSDDDKQYLKNVKEMVKVKDLADAQKILDAEDIDPYQADKIREKRNPTEDEKHMFEKFVIMDTFTPNVKNEKIDAEFILKVKHKNTMKKYRRYKRITKLYEPVQDLVVDWETMESKIVTVDGLPAEQRIEQAIQRKYEWYSRNNKDSKIDMLEFSKTNHKIKHVLGMIKAMGYTGANDTERLTVDYLGLRNYIAQNQKEIETLWKGRLKSIENDSVMRFATHKLKSCGLTLNKATKSKKDQSRVLAPHNFTLYKNYGVL